MENKKIDKRILNTKKALTQSLIELLGDKRIEKITIKELCTHAGINRGTFYIHYSDPDDLLNEIVDDFFKKTQEMVERMEGDEEKLKSAITDFLEFCLLNRPTLKVVLGRNVNIGIEEKFVLLFADTFKNKFAKAFDDVAVKDVSMFYRFLAAGFVDNLKYWLKGDISVDVEKIADLYYNFATKGIGAFKQNMGE